MPQLKTSLIVTLVTAAASLAGCSADQYRRQADNDVYRIVKDREKRTLDYEPDAEIPSESPPPIAQSAYERVPETPVPPAAPPPIEPVDAIELPYGPLGPDPRFAGLPVPEATVGSVEQTLEELREDNAIPLYGPPAPRRPINRFDLYRSLRYAVRYSREYQSRLEDLYLSALDVTLERHLLSPRPFVTQSATVSGGQLDSGYASALNATTAIGVRQQLPYGGEVVAQTLVTFVNALSDNVDSGESAQLVLSGSIPLLRGAGLTNLEGLISSERGVVYAVRSFEDYRRSFAVSIASQYFNLLARARSIENNRASLRAFERIYEQQRTLFAGGRVSFLQVQQAEQSLLSRQASLVNAQQGYQNAIDDFKIALGMPTAEDLEVVPTETTLDLPPIDKEESLKLARAYRLDLQTARDRIDDSRRQVANANNGLLPELNLTGEARSGNRAGLPAVGIDSRASTYSAGISLDLPVDRVAERNAYRRALISFQQAQRNLTQITDEIDSDVRSSIRGIKAAQAQLEIAERATHSAEQQIELAYELLKTGRSQTRDLVDAQNDLLDAQDDYDQAQVQLKIQVLNYLRATGTLRVDPEAGSIGKAIDRVAPSRVKGLQSPDVPPELAQPARNPQAAAGIKGENEPPLAR